MNCFNSSKYDVKFALNKVLKQSPSCPVKRRECVSNLFIFRDALDILKQMKLNLERR